MLRSCLLCPKGSKCRGHILHLLTLRMYAAVEAGGGVEEIARALSIEDRHLLADFGLAARDTCWTKSFVLTVARKLADLVAEGRSEDDLRDAVHHMVERVAGLYSRLPNGIALHREDLAMEVYNQACLFLAEAGAAHVVPLTVIGHACAAVLDPAARAEEVVTGDR